MYWNLKQVIKYNHNQIDKLQHEMYWNKQNYYQQTLTSVINYNMRCIETDIEKLLNRCELMINYNMRCIETHPTCTVRIEATDKLQHEMYWNCRQANINCVIHKINYNMRCIETTCNKKQVGVFEDKLQHEMYWNRGNRIQCGDFNFDKLQHEMYWNLTVQDVELWLHPDKLQHEMYWNEHYLLLYGLESW